MKKVLFVLCLIVLLTSFTFADSTIKVSVDGNPVSFDVQPQLVDGRTLVPVRAIFESLGFKVSWNADSKTVIGTKGDLDIELPIDSLVAKKRGLEISLDVPAQIINGRTLVPVRFIAESSGAEVGWEGETRTVTITSNSSAQTISSSTETIVRPSTPTGLFAFGVSPTEIRIGWDYVLDADNYHLYFSNSDNGPYELFSNDEGTNELQWHNEFSLSIYDLNPDEISYIKVASFKDGVESEQSVYVKTETRKEYLTTDGYSAYLNAYAKSYDFGKGEHIITFDEHTLEYDDEGDLVITSIISASEAEKMFAAFDAGFKETFENEFFNTMVSISEYGGQDAYSQIIIYEDSVPFVIDKYNHHEISDTHFENEDGSWQLIYPYYVVGIPHNSNEYTYTEYPPAQ